VVLFRFGHEANIKFGFGFPRGTCSATFRPFPVFSSIRNGLHVGSSFLNRFRWPSNFPWLSGCGGFLNRAVKLYEGSYRGDTICKRAERRRNQAVFFEDSANADSRNERFQSRKRLAWLGFCATRRLRLRTSTAQPRLLRPLYGFSLPVCPNRPRPSSCRSQSILPPRRGDGDDPQLAMRIPRSMVDGDFPRLISATFTLSAVVRVDRPGDSRTVIPISCRQS